MKASRQSGPTDTSNTEVHNHACRLGVILLAIGTLLGGTLWGEEAGKPAHPRNEPLQAVVVPAGPKIDGTFEDRAWQKAPVLDLGDVTSDEKAFLRTTARILLDDRTLYVGFECEDPDTKTLKKDCVRPDGPVWEDDCVELFISVDLKTGYKHIAVNPANTVAGCSYSPNGEANAAWDSGAKSIVRVEDKLWRVTLALPLETLGQPSGPALRFNLTRTRPERGDLPVQEYSWVVLPTSSYHQPKAFAKIENAVKAPATVPAISDIPKPLPTPTAELLARCVGDSAEVHASRVRLRDEANDRTADLLLLSREGSDIERASAAWALRFVLDPVADKALARAARDENLAVARIALLSLETRNLDGSVVEGMLDDPKPAVRWSAAIYLAMFGHPPGLGRKTAQTALSDPEAYIRVEAVQALRYYLDGDALTALTRCLLDTDERVRQKANQLLKSDAPNAIREPKARARYIDALLDILEKHQDNREARAAALERLTDLLHQKLGETPGRWREVLQEESPK